MNRSVPFRTVSWSYLLPELVGFAIALPIGPHSSEPRAIGSLGTLPTDTWRRQARMRFEPHFVEGGQLSKSWVQAISHAALRGVSSLAPLVVSVTDFADDGLPRENPVVRELLDRELDRQSTD